jgi:hypothetical protein
VYPIGVYPKGVHLMGMHLMGVYLGRVSCRRVSYGRAALGPKLLQAEIAAEVAALILPVRYGALNFFPIAASESPYPLWAS